MNQNDDPVKPVEIQTAQLSEEAVSGLIESFILREGTDYGRQEVSLETKINQVRRQLDQGHIKIIFDPATESINLLTLHAWKKLNGE